MDNYGTAGRDTDDNMAHAHYMQEAKGYKQTLGISYTHITFLAHFHLVPYQNKKSL